MRLKVRPRHMLVFAIRGKRKIGSFYSPLRGNYSDYHELQPVWIAEIGPESRLEGEVFVGDLGYILDVYELEDLALSLWPSYRKTLPASVVSAIEKEARDTDGGIYANIIHEDSLVGIEEETLWKKPTSSLAPVQLAILNSPAEMKFGL